MTRPAHALRLTPQRLVADESLADRLADLARLSTPSVRARKSWLEWRLPFAVGAIVLGTGGLAFGTTAVVHQVHEAVAEHRPTPKPPHHVPATPPTKSTAPAPTPTNRPSSVPADPSSLNPDQLSSLSPSQWASLTPSQWASLTPSQWVSPTPSQWASLIPGFWNGQGKSHLPDGWKSWFGHDARSRGNTGNTGNTGEHSWHQWGDHSGDHGGDHGGDRGSSHGGDHRGDSHDHSGAHFPFGGITGTGNQGWPWQHP